MMGLLVISSHFLGTDSGGEGERAYQLCKNYLKKKKVETTLITYKPLEKRRDYPKNLNVIEIKYIFKRIKLPIFTFNQILKIIKIIKQVENIHLVGYWNLMFFLTHPIILFFSKHYSICAAGSIGLSFKNNIIKILFTKVLGKSILKNASKCVSIVIDETKDYINLGVKKTKIVNIYNGIDINENLIYKKKNRSSRFPYILYVGRLAKIKGPDLLLKAFMRLDQKFENYKLNFVGYDDGMLSELKRIVKKNDLQSRVIFSGFKNIKEKSKLYNNASLVVLPSRSEAMSIVFLEAAIHKVPIIISKFCGLNHLEKKKLIQPFDLKIDSIKKSIQISLENKKLSNDLSIELYDYVKKNFTWDTIVEKYQELFDGINQNRKIETKPYKLLKIISKLVKNKKIKTINF